MAGNLFFGMLLTLRGHFNLLTSLFVFSGYIPCSALNTVVLVVREHPGGWGVTDMAIIAPVEQKYYPASGATWYGVQRSDKALLFVGARSIRLLVRVQLHQCFGNKKNE